MAIQDLKGQIASLPEQPGVYLYLGAGGETLYVGKAASLRDRVRSYLGAWCMPSRASLLTGRLQHAVMSMTMAGQYPGSSYDPAQTPFVPAQFRKQGYHTAQIGKWHTGTPPLLQIPSDANLRDPGVAKKLAEIAENLVDSFHKVGGINHLDGKNLPSRRAITSIAHDLLRLLFPGFFDEKLIHSSEIKAETASRLDALLGFLATLQQRLLDQPVHHRGYTQRLRHGRRVHRAGAAARHAGAEEQALDVVAPVEGFGQRHELVHLEAAGAGAVAEGIVDVLADHRRGDAILVRGVTESEAALDAGVAVVGDAAGLAGHPRYPPGFSADVEVELATDPAIGAGGGYNAVGFDHGCSLFRHR